MTDEHTTGESIRSVEQDLEDFEELGLELGRECLITTVQAMVELRGERVAREELYQHFQHSAKAFLLNVRDWLEGDEDLLKIAKLMVLGQYPLHKGVRSFIVEGHQATFTSSHCPFEGTLPLFCWAFCQVTATTWAREINPNMEVEYIPASAQTGHECKWTFRLPAGTQIESPKRTRVDLATLIKQIPKEEMTLRRHIYVGGIWELIARHLMDTVGEEVTLDKLLPLMRRNGFSFGMKLSALLQAGNDLKSIGRVVDCYNCLSQQGGGRVRYERDCACREITQCPYTDSVPSFCALDEAVAQGICSSLNPRFEFYFLKAMTKGDDSCHWVIVGTRPSPEPR